jgi:hypothetical protein
MPVEPERDQNTVHDIEADVQKEEGQPDTGKPLGPVWDCMVELVTNDCIVLGTEKGGEGGWGGG